MEQNMKLMQCLIRILPGADAWNAIARTKSGDTIFLNHSILDKLPTKQSGIFDNPNFWTFLTGVIGAIIGAGTAFGFQSYIESKKNKREIIEQYIQISHQISMAVGAARTVLSGSYSTQKSNPYRHFNIPAKLINFHSVPNFDISKLAYLSKEIRPDFYREIQLVLEYWKQLNTTLELRNLEYVNKFQPQITERLRQFPGKSWFSDEETVSNVDRVIQNTLKNLTDSIYEQIEYIEENGIKLVPEISEEIYKINKRQNVVRIIPASENPIP
jgi:hypothetical protein